MSDSLIEQVKRAAEALERYNAECRALGEGSTHPERHRVEIMLADFIGKTPDFPALLAHMQAQQAVVDAARKLRDGMNVGASDGNSHRHLSVQQWRWDAFKDALTALENLKPRSDNDGK